MIDFPSREVLMDNYTPVYSAFITAIANRQGWDMQLGEVKTTQIRGLGDLTGKLVGVDDTEKKQVIAGKRTKTFNKNFKRIKYTVDLLQNYSHVPGISNEVLEALLMQMDKEVFQGIGNNGILSSSDSDHTVNDINSEAIATLDGFYQMLYTLIKSIEVNAGNGPKTIASWGSASKFLAKLNTNTDQTYMSIMGRQLGNTIKWIDVPANCITGVTGDNANGIAVISDGVAKLNYTVFPEIENTGENSEDKYNYVNYLFGTANIECLRKDAVVVQPLSLTL